MTTQTTFPSSESSRRRAVITSAFLTSLHAIFTIVLIVVGLRVDVSAMQAIAGITLVNALVGLIAILLCKKGNISTGLWIEMIAISISIPAVSLFAAGYGWILFFSIPLVLLIIAQLNLKGRAVVGAAILGVISGGSGLLLDLLGSPLREMMPNSGLLIPIIVISIVALGIIILLQIFPRFELRVKLLWMFLVVSLVPVILMGLLNNRVTTNILTENANRNITSTAIQTSQMLDEFLVTTLQSIETNARLPILREFLSGSADFVEEERGDVSITLSILQGRDPDNILGVALLDRLGETREIYPTDGANPDQTASADVPQLWMPSTTQNEILNALMAGDSYISPVVFDQGNQGNLYFAAPIFSASREPLGVLVARYNALVLQDLVEDNNGLAGSDSFGVLFDENNLHIAHGIAPETLYKTVDALPPNQVQLLIAAARLPNLPQDELTTDLPELNQNLLNVDQEPIFMATDAATGDRVNQVAVESLETLPWKIAFFQPRDSYLSQIGQQTRTNLLLGVVVAGIVFLIAFAISRMVSIPISNLALLVERITTGDLSIQVPVNSEDEIGKLAASFNSMTAQIRGLLSGLENQVAERTKELERRAVQLQTAAEVARDASATPDLTTLLNHTVNLISDRFGFYHVGIFLLDEPGEYAVLQAANSEGGKLMLTQGHQLKVGEVGIVGNTTSTGEPHVALDVGKDSVHFAHSYLPYTRSEMALPLKVGAAIIGALDVQSERENAFDQEDIAILQIMADQIAVAIHNSRLLEQVQFNIFELQTAYTDYTQKSWQEWQQLSQFSGGYRYRGANIEMTSDVPQHAALAYKRGRPVQAESQNGSRLAVPIRLRDTTFGTVSLTFEGEKIPPEITNLVGQIAERLALALDNARLLETTQRRAVNEQIIREMTDQIRQTLDIETIMKTAAKEIGSKLGLAALDIQLDATVQNESISDRN